MRVLYSHNLAEKSFTKLAKHEKTITRQKIFKKLCFRPKNEVSNIPLPEDRPDRGDEPMPEEDKGSLVDTVDADGGHSEPIHNSTTQVRVT